MLLQALVVLGAGLSQTQLPQAKLSLLLPGPPKLIQSGANPDMPDSVEQHVWQARSEDCVVTITYDRWRRVHFGPEQALERYARQQLGITDYQLKPRDAGEHHAAVLSADIDGDHLTSLRVRSGEEAWQIDVREDTPEAGLCEDIVESVSVQAAPEPEGKWDEWGLVASKQPPVEAGNTEIQGSQNQTQTNGEGHTPPEVNPTPPPTAPKFKWEKQLLKEALVGIEAPIPLELVKRDLAVSERMAFSKVREYFGSMNGVEILVTHSVLDKGMKPDLEAWADVFKNQWTSQGADSVGGRQSLLKDGAQGFKIAGFWESRQTRVVLLTTGSNSWAIQIKAPLNGDSTAMIERIVESLQLNPKA